VVRNALARRAGPDLLSAGRGHPVQRGKVWPTGAGFVHVPGLGHDPRSHARVPRFTGATGHAR